MPNESYTVCPFPFHYVVLLCMYTYVKAITIFSIPVLSSWKISGSGKLMMIQKKASVKLTVSKVSTRKLRPFAMEFTAVMHTTLCYVLILYSCSFIVTTKDCYVSQERQALAEHTLQGEVVPTTRLWRVQSLIALL